MAVTTSLSKAWETKVLKALSGKENFSGPTNLWVALFTVAPTRTTGGTEVSGVTGYARKKLEPSKVKVIEATGNAEGEEGYFTNESEIKWEISGGEAEVKAAALMTAESAGENIAWGNLAENKIINSTNSPASYAAETLKFKLS